MKKHGRELRLAACLLALAMCAALLCGCTGKADSYTAAMPVIVVGSDNYPPFNYMSTDGTPTGIDVELATEAFRRLGCRAKFVTIDWEKKKELVENDTIDCIWGSFTMDGREEEYQWAGPYLYSRQVVAVRSDSDIYTLQDLAGKNLAVQSTTKPESIFLKRTDERIPKLGNLISLGHRELIFTFLEKGYADAVGAHEESVVQYMKDYDAKFRILDDPLMTVGIGVAFANNDDRGLCQELDRTLEEMRQDGTTLKIVGKYLDDPEKYLEVDDLGY